LPDEFGGDPNVRRMRRVFAWMERGQEALLKAAGLSPLDERLRCCRERARTAFEKAWACAAGRGLELTEADVGTLYVLCLARMLVGQGVPVPEHAIPKSKAAQRLLRELMP
jgi:hypothetical protein